MILDTKGLLPNRPFVLLQMPTLML